MASKNVLYDDGDAYRATPSTSKEGDGRSPYRRDWARLIHSTCFRRLQGKMQLFPLEESDFFRTRLTHSMEVAQIASGIVLNLNSGHKFFESNNINEDIVILAGLAHDLGHPPFGHNGERVLNNLMQGAGGFEGNAQTFRILTRIQKKETEEFPRNSEIPNPFSDDENGRDIRTGLGLTARSLAAVLKYDKKIPLGKKRRESTVTSALPKVKKGYYRSEKGIVGDVKKHVIGDLSKKGFRTLECSIMDVADDIAYSTYDLEDAIKAGFCSPMSIIALSNDIKKRIVDDVNEKMVDEYQNILIQYDKLTLDELNEILVNVFSDLFAALEEEVERLREAGAQTPGAQEFGVKFSTRVFSRGRDLCDNGYLRADFTSKLVYECLRGVQVEVCDKNPKLSRVFLEQGTFKLVETLKRVAFESIVKWHRMRITEWRGKEIIEFIFKTLKRRDNYELLPEDWQEIYLANSDYVHRARIVCDFIASMTDRYCVEFYSRLTGTNPPSMHKPY